MNAAEINETYFTWPALVTLGGSALAVIVVSNTVRALSKRDTPWVPFIVSIVVSFGVAHYTMALGQWIDYVLALLNSCLLFCTAAGMNQAGVELKPAPAGQPKPYGSRKVTWLSPWLRRLDS